MTSTGGNRRQWQDAARIRRIAAVVAAAAVDAPYWPYCPMA